MATIDSLTATLQETYNNVQAWMTAADEAKVKADASAHEYSQWRAANEDWKKTIECPIEKHEKEHKHLYDMSSDQLKAINDWVASLE